MVGLDIEWLAAEWGSVEPLDVMGWVGDRGKLDRGEALAAIVDGEDSDVTYGKGRWKDAVEKGSGDVVVEIGD